MLHVDICFGTFCQVVLWRDGPCKKVSCGGGSPAPTASMRRPACRLVRLSNTAWNHRIRHLSLFAKDRDRTEQSSRRLLAFSFLRRVNAGVWNETPPTSEVKCSLRAAVSGAAGLALHARRHSLDWLGAYCLSQRYRAPKCSNAFRPTPPLFLKYTSMIRGFSQVDSPVVWLYQ